MADTDKAKKHPTRPHARKRRGHSAETAAQAAAEAEIQQVQAQQARRVKAVRQLDPETFKQVDLMIGSFAQRRFANLMPKVAAGFFGAAQGNEQNRPELQQAFALYFVYGYRDAQGLRIVDMFARSGLKLEREQQRVVDACLRASLVVFGLERKNESNKQLLGRDILRGLPMTVLDNSAYDALTPGSLLVAYMFPIGDLWRPLGLGTIVDRSRAKAASQALAQLGQAVNMPTMQLADMRPAQIFWTAYRMSSSRSA